MRYVRIFFTHWEDALQDRARSIVWFILSIINPLIAVLFWRGAVLEKGEIYAGWTLPAITSYYFLLMILSPLLFVHIEEAVSYYDIGQGRLSQYLLRPFPYFLFKLFEELPYRLLQSSFGVVTFLVVWRIFPSVIHLSPSLTSLVFGAIIIALAFMLSFIFKMMVGLAAFWLTDTRGLEQIVGAAFLIFAGIVMPLEFFPTPTKAIVLYSPLAYMIYYPVIAIEGKLTPETLVAVVGMQGLWLIVLSWLYVLMWRRGVRMFSAVGL